MAITAPLTAKPKRMIILIPKPTPAQLQAEDPKEDVQPCGFLRLPGEIRNQIYDLVFQSVDIEIKWYARPKALTYWVYQVPRLELDQTLPWGIHNNQGDKGWNPKLGPKLSYRNNIGMLRPSTPMKERRLKYQRQSRQDPKMQSSHGPTRTALLLTCREVHDQAVTMFYSAHSFGFTSRRLLEKFLCTISPAAVSALSKMFIQHETYGEPYMTTDIQWKSVHDSKWAACCKLLSERLVNLTELHILLKINDQPLQLNLAANWAVPLLAFEGKGLKKFGLELKVRNFSTLTDSRLASCATVVRKNVLGDEYQEKKEEPKHNSSSLLSVRPRATKCLVIG